MERWQREVEKASREAFWAALDELACPGGHGHRHEDRSSTPASKCPKCVKTFLWEADEAPVKREFKLKPGETHFFDDRLDEPEVSVVGAGKDAYLWVGGAGCVGTLHGDDLRKLAAAILAALAGHARGPAPRPPRES